ncbi:MAG: UPF0175 family protein [Gammaproteobacteria bacterium]|nr:UPF0175 family protein [Gammaproteobacteria bacterium]NIX00949.1 UPF0175 family protein [Phycisphaerae bacterium]
MQVVVDIPDQYLVDYTVQEIIHYLKLYTALLMFQNGQLSAGAACEFAEIDRYTFLSACKRHHIAVVDYDEQEIDDDLKRLSARMTHADRG